MTDCRLTDSSAGVKYIYIGHNAPSGAKSSQFRIPTPACWTGATLIAATAAPGFIAYGDLEDDLLISYEQCYAGRFLIATATYFTQGTAPTCCQVNILKAPSAPVDGVAMTDCGDYAHLINAFHLMVNESGECPCYSPTHDATWGAIKALYSN